jgi:small-conductance mechanosensitive channel
VFIAVGTPSRRGDGHADLSFVYAAAREIAGALGVGVGFGLQNVVNNFVSGLILLFERPIQVGDNVQVPSMSTFGEVKRIGIRSSTVRLVDGSEVILPNATLISDPVTNWTLTDRLRRIELKVGVAYGSDPERVLELLRAVLATCQGIVASPEPAAFFSGFGDSSLDFVVYVWLERVDKLLTIRSNLALAVHNALRDAGIEIPFPQRDLHLRSVDPAVESLLRDDRRDDGRDDGKGKARS